MNLRPKEFFFIHFGILCALTALTDSSSRSMIRWGPRFCMNLCTAGCSPSPGHILEHRCHREVKGENSFNVTKKVVAKDAQHNTTCFETFTVVKNDEGAPQCTADSTDQGTKKLQGITEQTTSSSHSDNLQRTTLTTSDFIINARDRSMYLLNASSFQITKLGHDKVLGNIIDLDKGRLYWITSSRSLAVGIVSPKKVTFEHSIQLKGRAFPTPAGSLCVDSQAHVMFIMAAMSSGIYKYDKQAAGYTRKKEKLVPDATDMKLWKEKKYILAKTKRGYMQVHDYSGKHRRTLKMHLYIGWFMFEEGGDEYCYVCSTGAITKYKLNPTLKKSYLSRKFGCVGVWKVGQAILIRQRKRGGLWKLENGKLNQIGKKLETNLYLLIQNQ